MGDPTGEAGNGVLRLEFDRRLLLQLRGSTIPSNAGSQAYRELNDTRRARLRLRRAEAGPIVNDAWAEPAGPNADVAKVMRLFDQAIGKCRAFRCGLPRPTPAILGKPPPEQRAKFVALGRRPNRFWHRPAPLAGAPDAPLYGPADRTH